jgi:hypothetical protein
LKAVCTVTASEIGSFGNRTRRVRTLHSCATAAVAALMSCDRTPTTGQYTLAAETRRFEEKSAHKEQLKLAVALVTSGEAGGARSAVGMVEGCTRSQIETAL